MKSDAGQRATHDYKSQPDELFDEIEVCARTLKMSRSSPLAAAARDFLARRRHPSDATEAWNRAVAKGG